MAEETREPLRIDWPSAEVRKGRLRVPLAGEAPKGVRKRAETVLALIEPKAGGWGEIELHKDSIEVDAVQEGAEQELAHVLDSLITQINADFGHSPDGGAAEQREQAGAEDPREAADRQMSERFQALAENPEQRAEERTSDG